MSIESITFALHLVCVCLALGLPIFCVVDDFRSPAELGAENGSDSTNRGHWMLVSAAWLVAAAASGVVYGWMIWSPELANAIHRLGSRLAFAVVEFLFSLALMLACGAWYLRRPRVGTVQRWLRLAVICVGITNLIYHFPAVFAVINHLRRTPAESTVLTSADFRAMVFTPQTGLIGLHLLLAATLTGGLYLLTRAERPLGFWNPAKLIAVMLTSDVGLWIGGCLMYGGLPRDRLLELHDDRLALTLGWIAAVIVSTICQASLAMRPTSRLKIGTTG